MKKRILAIIFVLSFTLVMFAGCSIGGSADLGSGSTNPPDTADTAKVTPSATTAPAVTPGASSSADNSSTTPTTSTAGSSTADSGLTLAALQQAAKDTGFTVDKGTANYSNGKVPDPTAGVIAGIMQGGTNKMVVFILEFATDSDAQAYKTAMDLEEIMTNHTYAYKQFAVEFHTDAYDKESDLMAAFAAIGWVGGTVGSSGAASGGETSSIGSTGSTEISGLTLAALKQAVQDKGFQTEDGATGSFFADVNPNDGFTAVFTTATGEFNLAFFEFDSETDAADYKKSEDKPDDLFPEEYIIHGQFLGEVTSGFGAADDAAIREFVEDIFATASK